MIITLTTDFGIDDGYVAAMKGVLSSIAPGVPLIDITHRIPPQDVRSAAYVLWSTIPYFPPESVHLVVVDPGVGTARLPIASRTPWGSMVGPDNGVFSYLWALSPPKVSIALQDPTYHRHTVSHTFHGRDIFAPAAAHLAQGVPLEDLGPRLKTPKYIQLPRLDVEAVHIQGEVIYIDHFGNAITSIGRLLWNSPTMLHLEPAFQPISGLPPAFSAPDTHVIVKNRRLGPIRATYGDVSVGAPLALIGSEGMLELAANQGRGAEVLNLHIGAPVDLEFAKE